jgi:RNA polymerase sigma-70 factor, ECF subfamily
VSDFVSQPEPPVRTEAVPSAGSPPPYADLADELLVRQAQTDHAAFEALYRRHVTAVYRYCYARTQTAADAEDLTAQTFLVALETLDRYTGRGLFLGWLFGIARHKCADFHRGNRHYAETPWEDVAATRGGAEPLPEEVAACTDMVDCVERMLPQLSSDRREAVQLRYWGDLDFGDIARAMGRSVAATKMLISRGIADLRKRCLDEEA